MPFNSEVLIPALIGVALAFFSVKFAKPVMPALRIVSLVVVGALLAVFFGYPEFANWVQSNTVGLWLMAAGAGFAFVEVAMSAVKSASSF